MMLDPEIKKLLQRYKRGNLTEAELIRALTGAMTESLGYATLDHHRAVRHGFPEVIFCEGKTDVQVAEIAQRIAKRGGLVLATRASRSHYAAVKKRLRNARYNAVGRTITANEHLIRPNGQGTILIVTAGTSDVPVAEEARETARIMGNEVDTLTDVGVAGIHRILLQSKKLRSASVIIVVAGMDGALPSVVGGLVDVPVIAVPTSIGYGAHFGGIASLLTMLNSCAAGVLVVNIDNGFGAGFAASTINRRRS